MSSATVNKKCSCTLTYFFVNKRLAENDKVVLKSLGQYKTTGTKLRRIKKAAIESSLML